MPPSLPAGSSAGRRRLQTSLPAPAGHQIVVTRGPLNVHPAKLRELLERGLPAEESHERGDSTSTGTGNREVLPALLDHYGLYPWRVQLIAEGESDLAMLEEVLAARYDLSFGYLSIHAFALGGADIQANAELILGAVRVYSMPPPDASTHSPPIRAAATPDPSWSSASPRTQPVVT